MTFVPSWGRALSDNLDGDVLRRPWFTIQAEPLELYEACPLPCLRLAPPVMRRASHPSVRGFLVIRCLLLFGAGSVTAHAQQEIRPLAYTRYTLANGMAVILNVDHATPLVAVNLAFHVGSKDDPPQETGITHLCEHALSLGSANLDQPQQSFYRSIGGSSARAETTADITTFYLLVPPNQLETVLWAESDRIAAPFGRLTPERLSVIRGVVGQERQQNVENATFGVSRELTLAALFPTGHPYHLESAAAGADLTGLTVTELQTTCAPFYTPANAVLSLSGDFDPQRTREWIAKYFASIPAGATMTHRQLPPVAPRGERRLVLEDRRAAQPQLHLDWVGAGYTSPDRGALMALASLLSANRFGRLSRVLVEERQLATSVSATHYDFEGSGVFEIGVVPRAAGGASLSTIETLVDSVVAGFATSPPTVEELARFNAANAVTATTSLQSKLARADALAHDQMFAGDPAFYAAHANEALRLTPADVQRAAAKYLTSSRVVMSLVQAGQLGTISKPDLPFVNVTPSRGATRP